MKIVIFGHKSCGKTAAGKMLAEMLGRKFFDLDGLIEETYFKKTNEKLSFREIYKKHGKDFFRDLEKEAVEDASKKDGIILAVGGGTLAFFDNEKLLKKNSVMVFLNDDCESLFKRMTASGIPAFLDRKNPKESFEKIFKERTPHYKEISDIIIDSSGLSIKEIAEKAAEELKKRGKLGKN